MGCRRSRLETLNNAQGSVSCPKNCKKAGDD